MSTIKELPYATLKGTKVRTPQGQEGYWYHSNEQAVMLSDQRKGGNIIRIPVSDINKTLDWTVLEERPGRKCKP